MLKRRTYIFISVATALLIGSTISSVNAAAPKVGSACKKVGTFLVTPGTRFVCNKEGKKLVWRIGNSGASQNTSTAPAAPAAPEVATFKAPIPITLPVAQNGTITFANILSRISDIPGSAFNNAEALIEANTSPSISHAIYIAPTLESIVARPDVEKVLDRAMKYYAGFQQSSYFDLYIYDYSTITWANDQYEKVAKTRKYATFANYDDRYLNSAKGACGDGDCYGSQSAIVPGTNEGFLNVPVDNGKHWFLDNGTLAHSYGHTVQSAQWDGTKVRDVNALKNAAYTGWLFQGGVTQPAWTIATGTLSGYLEQRNNQGFNLRNSGFKNLSAQSITNYLLYSSLTEGIDVDGNKINGSAYPPNPIWNIGNSTGSMAVECLAAIGGPQSVTALFTLEAQGNSFDAAFAKIYGVSWQQAAATLGQVIASEYAQTTPTPR